MKTACEKNIQTYCKDLTSKIEVVQCLSTFVLNDTLLDNTQRIDSACRSQLKFELLQMNEDVRLDPILLKACSRDIANNCANIQFGKAQVFECLKSNSDKLSNPCAKRLLLRKKIDLIDQGVDYALKERCKTAILQYCSTDVNVDILSCLRKNLLQPSIDTVCRRIVINRIMTQNVDVRLNPTLWQACRFDTEKSCKVEFSSLDNGEELNGRVIKCLKNAFVKSELTRDCSLEIEQIMREAANIDYRLDPILTEACFNEVQQFCSDVAEDKKEDCLRLNFQQKKISPDARCYSVSYSLFNW